MFARSISESFEPQRPRSCSAVSPVLGWTRKQTGTTGLREYLEAIMAYFVRHFEGMITYLGQPGVPRMCGPAAREDER